MESSCFFFSSGAEEGGGEGFVTSMEYANSKSPFSFQFTLGGGISARMDFFIGWGVGGV